ncbi:MAG: hypothetical protein ABSE06_13005 [Anaerolineaceae bacterium]
MNLIIILEQNHAAQPAVAADLAFGQVSRRRRSSMKRFTLGA